MNTKVVVDASLWVSRLMPQEVNHNASSLWTEQFTTLGGMLVAPVFLLIEVAASIARQSGQPDLSRQSVTDLQTDEAMSLIPLDSTLVETAIELASTLQLRAGDAIYVALAHQMSIPLVSWDKEQLQRASRLITTYTPENYVFPGDEEKSNEQSKGDHEQDIGLK